MNSDNLIITGLPEKLSGAGLDVGLLVRSNGVRQGSMNVMSPLYSAVETSGCNKDLG